MTNDEVQGDQQPPFQRPSGTRLPTSRQEPSSDALAPSEDFSEEPVQEEAGPPPPLLEELGETSTPESAPALSGPRPDQESVWLAPLHNRLIIASASLLVLLALTAGVLFVFSRGSGSVSGGTRVSASNGDGDATATPQLSLTALARNTATVFNGPDDTYAPLGTIRSGARVSLVGRNEDASWLQVNYPPGSSLRGWVNVAFFEVTGDTSRLELAGPGAGPDVAVPTSNEPPIIYVPPTDTPVSEDEPTNTPQRTNTPRRTNTPEPDETEGPTDTPRPTSTSAFATLTPEEDSGAE